MKRASIRRVWNILRGGLQFMNPFSREFGRSEKILYLSRKQGPSGLWEKLPRLHYHLFQYGREELITADATLQRGAIRKGLPLIVLITDDISSGGFGLGFDELCEEILGEFNLAVIYLRENPANLRIGPDTISIGPLLRHNAADAVAEEVAALRSLVKVEAIIALSIGCTEVLPALDGTGLPLIHWIPEFLKTPRQGEDLVQSSLYASLQVYPSVEILEAARKLGVSSRADTVVIPPSRIEKAFSGVLRSLLGEAKVAEGRRQKEVNQLTASRSLLPGYSFPATLPPIDAARNYLAGWRSGWRPVKPFPGFHPGIYRMLHPESDSDPLLNYLDAGKPSGPWLMQVITDHVPMIATPPDCNAGFHLHLHYCDGAEVLLKALAQSHFRPDLLISTTSEETKRLIGRFLEKYGLVARSLEVFPNRGRDIGPLLTGFGQNLCDRYEVIGHFHTKKSPHAHDDYLERWTGFLFNNLIGDRGRMMDVILTQMARDQTLGMVFPDDPGVFGWEGNHSLASDLLRRAGFAMPDQDAPINFPVGTMFWARSSVIRPLVDLNLGWEDYPPEPVRINGTLLHAVERIFGVLPGLIGLRSAVTHAEGTGR
jgi:Rhamnan synthesis protein F